MCGFAGIFFPGAHRQRLSALAAMQEAIFLGLPAMVSQWVGCVGPTHDVRPGRNGIEYSFGNIDGLARAIEGIASHAERLAEMSKESRRITVGPGFAASVSRFVAAVYGPPVIMAGSRASVQNRVCRLEGI